MPLWHPELEVDKWHGWGLKSIRIDDMGRDQAHMERSDFSYHYGYRSRGVT